MNRFSFRVIISLVLFTLLSSNVVFGQALKLASVFGDHMVLQRDQKVPVWGTSSPFTKISVFFAGQKKNTVSNSEGKWIVKLDPMKGTGQGSELIIKAKEKIVIKDVVVGEVWLCSGQSNMYQPLGGYNGQPTFGATDALKKANNIQLRLFHVNKKGSAHPLDTLKAFKGWSIASAESILDYSAIAYFFGQQLQEVLDVPVGMIHTSWGGSRVQAWMSNSCISKYQQVNLEGKNLQKNTNHTPTLLYNAMIHPLIPFAIRGALWYQGESNRKEPELYKTYFSAMVKDWRSRWNIGNFPFYYVQIAPYKYNGDEVGIYNKEDNSAFIREAQQTCLQTIPNSGMAVTIDIGEKDCIHPAKKKEVADRLLYLALNKTYNQTAFKCGGPVYDSMEVKNDGILLKFKNIPKGLNAPNGLHGFEIAGENHVFYPAMAKLANNKQAILVKSDEVKNPVAVRYAWRNWTVGTLFDNFLFPVSSFRTDDWNEATRVE
ncbi:MAG: sialate O-acetylesterase [Bacteroidales bacterium]|nr:sialate O-acetylesterase [Bacteroidales bacterium]